MFLPRPNARIALVSVAIVFGYLFFIHGYATGYLMIGRDPLWDDMRWGYQRDNSEWSFGYFVPFAVLALIWFMRSEFMKLEVKPANWSGFFVLLLGFFFFFGGYRANVAYFGYFAGQILLMGTVLWFLGWSWFRRGFWLWCLFGMVWPLVFLIQPISFPLQKVMVVLTAGFLKLIGVGAVADGTSIFTNTLDPVTGDPINLNIAAACSGLRSLFALIMIGLIFACIMLKSEWKRCLLMASIPLVAILANFVRMLMLYFGAKFGGSEFAIGRGDGNESPYHIGSGLVVFVVALILVSVIVSILNQGLGFFKRKKVVTKVVSVGEAEAKGGDE